MINYPIRRAATLRRDEGGQMAFMMVLTLTLVFMFFALALDAGLWYLDHRTAQNQADAAVLAAVQELPDDDIDNGDPATKAVYKWLQQNGSNPGDLNKSGCPASTSVWVEVRPGLEYSDRQPNFVPGGGAGIGAVVVGEYRVRCGVPV